MVLALTLVVKRLFIRTYPMANEDFINPRSSFLGALAD
jgi:hypothetical protein